MLKYNMDNMRSLVQHYAHNFGMPIVAKLQDNHWNEIYILSTLNLIGTYKTSNNYPITITEFYAQKSMLSFFMKIESHMRSLSNVDFAIELAIQDTIVENKNE